MEQRPLRLGDIVDDYCPRERRITNHVIVALVKNAIRQTRCSTCDTEHVFKAARPPQRRLKDGEAAPPGQLVARGDGAAAPDQVPAEPAAPRAASAPPVEPPAAPVAPPPAESAARPGAHAAPATSAEPAPVVEERADDIWPAHRQLIRATLPRVEGEQKEPRPIPEFTMHHPRHGYGRGGPVYRADGWSGNGHGRGGGGGGFRQGPPRDPQGGGLPGGGGGQPGAGGGGKRRRHRRRGRGPKVG